MREFTKWTTVGFCGNDFVDSSWTMILIVVARSCKTLARKGGPLWNVRKDEAISMLDLNQTLFTCRCCYNVTVSLSNGPRLITMTAAALWMNSTTLVAIMTRPEQAMKSLFWLFTNMFRHLLFASEKIASSRSQANQRNQGNVSSSGTSTCSLPWPTCKSPACDLWSGYRAMVVAHFLAWGLTSRTLSISNRLWMCKSKVME